MKQCPKTLKIPQGSSLPEKQETSSESAMRPSDDGQKPKKLKASSRRPAEGCMTLKALAAKEIQKQLMPLMIVRVWTHGMIHDPLRICMLAFLLRNKEMTSKGRSSSSKKNFQKASSSRTSQAASTGNAKASGNSWISRVPEISTGLSWWSVIDSAGSRSSSSNMFSRSTGLSSKSSALRILLLNKSFKKTSSASSKSSAAEETEEDDTKRKAREKTKIPEDHVIATRKIKINPTRKQKQQFDKLAGCVRVVYNASIARINGMRNRTIEWPQGKLSQHLRNKFATNIHNDKETYTSLHGDDIDSRQILTSKTNNEKSRYVNPFFFERPWLSECPKDYRGRAAFKAADAYDIARKQWQRGTIRSFKMSFASKKKELAKGTCFGIERKVTFLDGDPANKRSGTLTILGIDGPIRFFEKPPIVKTPEMGCELSRDICGDYWLHVPIFRRKKPQSGSMFVAIDPGGVVPWAFYSPAGESGSLGVSMNRRLVKRSKEIAVVDNRISKSNDPLEKDRLYAERRKLFRAKKRVRDHEHYRAINFLTGRYDGVLLPKLKTKNLSGALKPKANHDLQDISHYTFLRRLTERCTETNTVLEHPGEHWTSKTCGHCSASNIPGCDRVGTYRPYKCLRCGLVAHRDVHAARNIYMKWYIELTS